MPLDLNTPGESKFGQYIESRFDVLGAASFQFWVDIIIGIYRPTAWTQVAGYCEPWSIPGSIAYYNDSLVLWHDFLSAPHPNGAIWGACFGNNHWMHSSEFCPDVPDAYFPIVPPAGQYPDRIAHDTIGRNWTQRHIDFPLQPYATVDDFWRLFNKAKSRLEQDFNLVLTPGLHGIRLTCIGDQWFDYDYRDYETYPNPRPDRDIWALFVAEVTERYARLVNPSQWTFAGYDNWVELFYNAVPGARPPDEEPDGWVWP